MSDQQTVMLSLDTVSEDDPNQPRIKGLDKKYVRLLAEAGPENLPPPARMRGEDDKALYGRLVEWAEDHDVDAPPKPTGGVFSTGYDKVLVSWREQVVT